jgi:polyisoprenoid-binding protein YceI
MPNYLRVARFSFAAGILLIVSSILVHAEGVATKISAAKAGTYKVDPYHTQIVFSLSHLGFTNFTGTFSDVSGSLKFDPKNIGSSKLDITLPTTSVLTPVTKLNDELKGVEWFDAANYPDATFSATKISPDKNDAFVIIGNMTMHGVTKPVSLKARFIGAGVNPINKVYTIGFEATATIKRAEFGVNKYVPLVGDNVHLTIAGAFELEE